MKDEHIQILKTVIPANDWDNLTLENYPEYREFNLKVKVAAAIESCFKSMYKEQNKLIVLKRALGFCSTINCLHISGKYVYCYHCRKQHQDRKHQNRRSEYGKLQLIKKGK